MAKYSIIFLCYLFSCFIAVVPHISEENVKSQISASSNVSSENPRELITFSNQHGVLAVLSDDQRTVTKTSPYGGLALVYTNRRLERNELFEIKITEMEPGCDVPNPLTFGTIEAEPNSLMFTRDAFLSDSSTYMVHWTHLYLSLGDGFRHIKDNYLPNLPKEGDRLGVLHKTDGGLYFYMNGVEINAVAGTRNSVFAFVEMHGCYKSVKIL